VTAKIRSAPARKELKATVKELRSKLDRAHAKAERLKSKVARLEAAKAELEARVKALKKLNKRLEKAPRPLERRSPVAKEPATVTDIPTSALPSAAVGPTPSPAPVSVSPDASWTVVQLRAEARSRGIDGLSRKSKAQLLAVLLGETVV